MCNDAQHSYRNRRGRKPRSGPPQQLKPPSPQPHRPPADSIVGEASTAITRPTSVISSRVSLPGPGRQIEDRARRAQTELPNQLLDCACRVAGAAALVGTDRVGEPAGCSGIDCHATGCFHGQAVRLGCFASLAEAYESASRSARADPSRGVAAVHWAHARSRCKACGEHCGSRRLRRWLCRVRAREPDARRVSSGRRIGTVGQRPDGGRRRRRDRGLGGSSPTFTACAGRGARGRGVGRVHARPPGRWPAACGARGACPRCRPRQCPARSTWRAYRWALVRGHHAGGLRRRRAVTGLLVSTRPQGDLPVWKARWGFGATTYSSPGRDPRVGVAPRRSAAQRHAG
jgi:hypothetical protein